jgi:hypothetical protein
MLYSLDKLEILLATGYWSIAQWKRSLLHCVAGVRKSFDIVYFA